MRRQRASLVIILATGLFAGVPAWAPDAFARSGVQLTINGQPGPRLSFETLTENQGPRQLTTTRDSAGGRSKQSVGGTPAATLVQLIGFNPSSVDQLEVLRPGGGGSVLLDTDEIVDGFDGDPRGTRFATFDTSRGNRIFFFRPLRSDGLSSERVTGPIGKDLRVNLFTDAPALNVTSSADKTKSSAGADVRFRSSADGDGRHFYFWDFGDGTVG
ncbi:MAG: hypothetical protein M3417_00150, partial [Actinomycetota bacterium]|nr:hypothetical protein [Actinomycetota bacterium]